MKKNIANEAADTDNNNVFSMTFNSSWKPSNEKESTKSPVQESSAATYQMQIDGNIIMMTPQSACVGGNRTNGKNPASVARRNARERRRIKNVNSAFDELRQHVPVHGDGNRKKMSKVDCLQSAIEYIKALEELVRNRRSAAANPQTNNNSDNKENLSDNVDVSSSLSDFTDSESEENGPVSHSNKDNETLLTSYSESAGLDSAAIADYMRKAFDIMLQKTNSNPDSAQIPHIEQKENNNSNHLLENASLSPSLTHAPSDLSSQILFSDANEEKNVALPNSIEMQNDGISETDFSSFVNPSGANVQPQPWPTFSAENGQSQWSPNYTTPSIFFEDSPTFSRSSESSNSTEADDDLFGSQPNFVPMAIDQINPSIDFLPSDDQDISRYTDSFLPSPENPLLEQSNPVFAHPNLTSDNCWVLARLN